jgi:predicted phosphodiesterase
VETFKKVWGEFGDRLHWVCGNHDVHFKRPAQSPLMVRVDLPGVILAMLDTSIEGKAAGQVSAEQLALLKNIAQSADRPVMVFGHHHIWDLATKRDPQFFGINPNDSEKLIELFRQEKCMIGYFSGHTHSNRLQVLRGLPGVVFVQCGAVKEFPGAWDEYRVYEGGIQQIMHRVLAPESLRWEEETSKTEGGAYEKHHFAKLTDRCFTIHARL